MLRAAMLSIGYRVTRKVILGLVSVFQCLTGQKKDLETAIIIGDRLMKDLAFVAMGPLFTFKPPKTPVKLYDLTFPSPLVVSAFKDDMSILRTWLKMGMGGATIKTVMTEARSGNPRPRIQGLNYQRQASIINAMGLPSKGVDITLKKLEKSPLFQEIVPLGISIGGHCLDDYIATGLAVLNFIKEHSQKQLYMEINISCPNTKEGQSLLEQPALLRQLLNTFRNKSTAIIGIKLSPDQSNTDLETFASIVKDFDRTYLCLGNTQYKTESQAGLKKGSLSRGGGGLSGPTLYSRTLEMTQLLAKTGLPIMAIGGIDAPQKAQALLDNGATLIGMATALVLDPYCIPKINQSLKKRSPK